MWNAVRLISIDISVMSLNQLQCRAVAHSYLPLLFLRLGEDIEGHPSLVLCGRFPLANESSGASFLADHAGTRTLA